MTTLITTPEFKVIKKETLDGTIKAVEVPDKVIVIVEKDNKFLMTRKYNELFGSNTTDFLNSYCKSEDYTLEVAAKIVLEHTGLDLDPYSLSMINSIPSNPQIITSSTTIYYINLINYEPKEKLNDGDVWIDKHNLTRSFYHVAFQSESNGAALLSYWNYVHLFDNLDALVNSFNWYSKK